MAIARNIVAGRIGPDDEHMISFVNTHDVMKNRPESQPGNDETSGGNRAETLENATDLKSTSGDQGHA
ncbi:hypothetical protein GCM10023155_46600 [Bremerella cremea]